MDEKLSSSPMFGRLVSIAAIAVMVIIAILDVSGHQLLNYSILYFVPLLLAAMARDRHLIWVLALVSSAMAMAAFQYSPARSVSDLSTSLFINRGFVVLGILLVAAMLHVYVGIYLAHSASVLTSEQQRQSLEASNFELAQREEEIARQNEELQSQTEELERQSEELRITNEELSRREKMLESLLALSRSLAGSTTRAESMDKICATLGELINGPGVATAIIERHGEEVRVACHRGFGEQGPEREAWPYKKSFASLVIERGRTGFLEDVSLRPDLQIVQPRQGEPMRSVLAAPLRAGDRIVGSLEVFRSEKHSWSDEQINLIESLAAQASISLEAASLFERIEDERRRLKAVLDTVPFGVAIAEAGSTEMRLNPAGAAMLNVPPDVPIDPTVSGRWKLFREGKAIPIEEGALFRAMSRGEEISNEEYELVFPSGRRLAAMISAAPIRSRDGTVLGAVAAFVDITPQKNLQIELDMRRREAEESSVRKSRFLAAVSHDIRTPANAISLLAELLDRTAGSPKLAEEVPEIARDLKTSALTLVNLVSDVLDLTRFDSGRIDLNESDFPLAQIIEDECRQLAPMARDKGLQFDCNLPPPNLLVRADRVKLSRILANLISNAIKFTGRGRVHIEGLQDLQSGDIIVRVTDTGPGIPAEHHDRIFDEFFQLRHATPQQRDNGSGLGLAICRRLAHAMGGQIEVHSADSQGSTFTFTLPASVVVPV